MKSSNQLVVIGAGIGGLSAAAYLAKAGLDVIVLESHIYPGGCAGTFYHQGYLFDAGATLAGGFYPGGPMDILAHATGIDHWPGRSAETAMLVHLPDGNTIPRVSGNERWDLYQRAFDEKGVEFFQWQERTATIMWNLALRLPPWPPQSARDVLKLIQKGSTLLGQDSEGRIDQIILDACRPVSMHLNNASNKLRLFVDAQLLISAQTTSEKTNALYGASALDLPRRGVFHLEGGMGAIAARLVASIRQQGGEVLFRQKARKIVMEQGLPTIVETKKGDVFQADLVIANLTPWNIAALLGDQTPFHLRRFTARPPRGWGAFVVYCGVNEALIPQEFPLHHQVVTQRPLGEGNSVFVSVSPAWDASRAPVGHRAITLSTHTSLDGWWELYEKDRQAYQVRVGQFTQKILAATERVIPGLRQGADLILPGTPVTFQRFTHRARGWVGGFPQVNLFQNWGSRIAPNLWMVGDSIFPGQSVTATALGGLRVAETILQKHCMVQHETGLHWAESS